MSKPVNKPVKPASKPVPAPQAKPVVVVENPISPAENEQVELHLANTVSRLGCTVSEAREYLARQSAEASNPPDSKSSEDLL